MEKKANVFQDSNRNYSSARVGAFVIIAIACFLTCWIVIVDEKYLQAAALFSSMTGVAITLYILGKKEDNRAMKIELGSEGIKSVSA